MHVCMCSVMCMHGVIAYLNQCGHLDNLLNYIDNWWVEPKERWAESEDN